MSRIDSETPAGRLAQAIRTRRRALRLTQKQLCDLAGCGVAFLYELETAKPTVRLDKLLAVLEVLGLELHVIEGHDGITVAAPPAPPRDGAP